MALCFIQGHISVIIKGGTKEVIMSDTKKPDLDKLIAQVAQKACLGTEGVASMAPVGSINLRGQRIFEFKGVRLVHDGKKLSIDLYLDVSYGTKIPETAWNVQLNVKQAVERVCNVALEKVNINIQGVNFDIIEKK